MSAALILSALVGATAPTQMTAPQCFETTLEASLYVGEGWGEALIAIGPAGPDAMRLTYQGDSSWTEVTGRPGRYCITAFGENL